MNKDVLVLEEIQGQTAPFVRICFCVIDILILLCKVNQGMMPHECTNLHGVLYELRTLLTPIIVFLAYSNARRITLNSVSSYPNKLVTEQSKVESVRVFECYQHLSIERNMI